MTMSRRTSIRVNGLPRPQGSIRMIPRKHGAGAFVATYPQPVWEWRSQVQQAVAERNLPTILGPVELRLGFELPRIQSHYLPINGKRREPELRPNAPVYPIVAPDIDKLARCVADAITDAGVWKDDSQVVYLEAGKRYANELPGVLITIIELEPPCPTPTKPCTSSRP